MPALDLAAFRAAPLTCRPFAYLVLPRFVRPEACAAINAGYPQIDQPGSFPVGALSYGPAFRDFVAAMTGSELRQAFEEKFQIDLRKRPTMITVRGRCGPKDGNIHTDAVRKLITVLIYMNPTWEQSGGRLRLLRSATDIEDALVEVPPEEGTLVAFRRSNNSFHGHKPFTGLRRVIQLNWVTDRWTVQREILRHRVSAWMKRVLGRRRKAAPSPW
jgi:SM-20-related protein